MKTAIVTGAGRGLGLAEAHELARHGLHVIVSDIDEATSEEAAEKIRRDGGAATAVPGDCADADYAAAAVARADEVGEGLVALVNNAGIVRDRTLLKMSESEWDAVIRVHLRGHFTMTQAACRSFRERQVPGRIVCTSSTSGLMGKFGQSNYGAAKSGVASFAQIVAWEMARYGIRCNAIVPTARTPMTEGALGDFDSPDGGWDFWAPENVASLVAYLCLEQSDGISGKVFGIQGDLVEVYQPWTSIAARDNGGARFSVEDLAHVVPDLLTSVEMPLNATDQMERVRIRPGSGAQRS